MGPRSWDRGEMSAIPPARPAGSALQWGRGLGTAESAARRLRQDRKLPGFNGAAVLGPRRARRITRASSPTIRFNGAAVLGPRRVFAPPSCARNSAWLQWGRGLGTAESLLRNRGSATNVGSFNGAAVLGPRRDDGTRGSR